MVTKSDLWKNEGEFKNTVISKLEEGESILAELGAGKLNKKMRPIGALCGIFLRHIDRKAYRIVNRCNRDYDYSCGDWWAHRMATLNMLSFFAPVHVSDERLDESRDDSGPYVIGFNHPSLGEIIRLIGITMECFPRKQLLLPVNLAWYENIIPYKDTLGRLGIYICPIITPSTEQKIRQILGDDTESINKMEKYKLDFFNYYMGMCRFAIASNDVILAAPSATRQATVFPSRAAYDGEAKLNPVMAAIALAALKDKHDCTFVPIAVVPPKRSNRLLNLFKCYELFVCEYILPDKIKQMKESHTLRDLDRDFLNAISSHVPESMVFPET